MARPTPDEAAEYYFTYIDKVADGDVCELMRAQASDLSVLLRDISDETSFRRYAPDKWSIRQVLSHLADTERVFASRAFWFARGFDSALPSYDDAVAVAAARADERAWTDLVAEFEVVRQSTIPLFTSLSPDAWDRRGIASDRPFTVRALAYIIVGHVEHHVRIVRDRYLSTVAR